MSLVLWGARKGDRQFGDAIDRHVQRIIAGTPASEVLAQALLAAADVEEHTSSSVSVNSPFGI